MRWTVQGLTEPFAVEILQRRKVKKCVQFTGQRAISQKMNDVCNKTLRLALEYVENCRSRVSSVAFSCLDGQILVHKFPKFDRP